MTVDDLRKQFGDRFKENVVIRDYVATLAGGIVDWLIICESIEQIIEAVVAVRKLQIKHVIIGQGSNVLFSDVGYNGVVIINRTNNISFIPDKSKVIADSGVLLSRLIMEAASRDLTGLEFLFGLRGTVGGAVVNNRQANGVAIGSLVKAVTLLMPDNKIAHYPAKWLDFEPFTSRIMRCRKNDPSTILPVILTVTLQFSLNKKEEILRKIQYFGGRNRSTRPLNEASIGPVFKDINRNQLADQLLKSVKLNKIKVGRAKISVTQPNFIMTNERGLGALKTADIAELVNELKRLAKDSNGVNLMEAFEYIGDWPNEDQLVAEYE